MNSDTSFGQRLAQVDLSMVMQHVQYDTGLENADIARAEDLYRKFLILKDRYPNRTIVPPRLVDEVWHAHITFTRQYAADCEFLFGQFMHHEPSTEALTSGYDDTVQLYQNDFALNLNLYGASEQEWMAASWCK